MLLDFMTEIRNETIVHCRSFTHESDFVAFQEPFKGFTAADNRESFLQVHARRVVLTWKEAIETIITSAFGRMFTTLIDIDDNTLFIAILSFIFEWSSGPPITLFCVIPRMPNFTVFFLFSAAKHSSTSAPDENILHSKNETKPATNSRLQRRREWENVTKLFPL